MGPEKTTEEETKKAQEEAELKAKEGKEADDAALKEIDDFFDATAVDLPDYDPGEGPTAVDGEKKEGEKDEGGEKEPGAEGKKEEGEEGDEEGEKEPVPPKTIMIDGVDVPVENVKQMVRQFPGLQTSYAHLLKATEVEAAVKVKEEEKKEPEPDPFLEELRKEDKPLADLYEKISDRLGGIETGLKERDERDAARDNESVATNNRQKVMDGYYGALMSISEEDGFEDLATEEGAAKFTEHIIAANPHPVNVVNPVFLKGAYAEMQGAKSRPAKRQRGSRARVEGGSSRSTTPELNEQEKEIDSMTEGQR